jgi:hypothetical protein
MIIRMTAKTDVRPDHSLAFFKAFSSLIQMSFPSSYVMASIPVPSIKEKKHFVTGHLDDAGGSGEGKRISRLKMPSSHRVVSTPLYFSHRYRMLRIPYP